MECPKCHRVIKDNAEVCPYCHKVLALTCPNCHNKSKSSVCPKCGYIILEKCAKCGRLTPVTKHKCKCGLEVSSSIAVNECETDEFASVTLKFGALSSIRKLLASSDLYAKFLVKLRNLVVSQLKNVEGNVFLYGDTYEINFNKELSFATSVNKALRFSIKVLNAFAGLNQRVQDELGCNLKINLIIQRKKAEELLVNKSLENNVKLLMTNNKGKKYLKGMQIILDQYSRDCISNDYKTDSLYSLEQEGMSVIYYELLLESYVLPPNKSEDTIPEVNPASKLPSKPKEEDMYGFKVFDINARCGFKRYSSEELLSKLQPENKIVALRGEKELQIKIHDLVKYYTDKDIRPLYISCTDELSFKPWGFFEKIYKEYNGLSTLNGLIDDNIPDKRFNKIKDFIKGIPIKASSPEDARFACMDMFVSFLQSLRNLVIIVDGFEKLDDTSIQTLELYFDRFKRVNINFVFLTNASTSVHSKIKGLLHTHLYAEITMVKNGIAPLLSDIKEDAEDFIQSFYYEKIKENFQGSKLYFEHAVNYLLDKEVLISFENKLLIKNSDSFILPRNLESLIKLRLKAIGKNQDASMILAYSAFLGERLDFAILELLGIKDIEKNIEYLNKTGFTYTNNGVVYINNYDLICPMLKASLKKEIQEILVKNLIGKLGKLLDNTVLLTLMGQVSMYKEMYMLLWKNSQSAIESGDYDAYLKNCLNFLSITDKISGNVPKEAIEANKKEVYQNILMSLYAYSPAKIYSIENVLLMDAIQANDNEKIAKLSNLMLQGALIDSNYTEAIPLLHNILSRMENPSLIVNGEINTKFFLLSLVNIEVLFNIGDYQRCISTGEDILKVLKPEILEKVKPASFSVNFFLTHLMETFRLVCFAKLLTCDNTLEVFFDDIKRALNEDLPEKDCILAIKDYLAGKTFAPSGTEEATAFSKVIYLLLQELSKSRNDYKFFAQNVYQAKLLASDLHQAQLEYICDMLIAYAYSKVGVKIKANAIYNDIFQKSEGSAIFNIYMLVRYFKAMECLSVEDVEGALLIINDALADIQKSSNNIKVFYAMFEKLYINVAKAYSITSVDIIGEQQKLLAVSPNGELERIVKKSELDVTLEKTELVTVVHSEPNLQELEEETEKIEETEQAEQADIELVTEENKSNEPTEEQIAEEPKEPEDDLADLAENIDENDDIGAETD